MTPTQKSPVSKPESGRDTVTFTDNRSGKSVEFPILNASLGPSVVDVRKLYAETGLFTFDPGYGSTGSCESNITYIDGEKGILMHRGYRIEDLAKQSDYPEVCYLLLNGELPTVDQKDRFLEALKHHTM
ncbi:MAG: citrate (Si)-synthase, partial [Rhodospirillaceae bacterium]|nr:citrate (Si)-synthase [Rhodospirillaceae bacterium]